MTLSRSGFESVLRVSKVALDMNSRLYNRGDPEVSVTYGTCLSVNFGIPVSVNYGTLYLRSLLA